MKSTSLPNYSQIDIAAIPVKLDELLQRDRETVAQLLTQNPPFTWQNLMYPLETLDDELNRFWSPISHLNSVVNSPEMREVYNQCVPKITEYNLELWHNESLYAAMRSLASGPEFDKLDSAQKKVIENHMRDFKLSGISLPAAQKKIFTDLSKEISSLAIKFEENVLDATHGWNKLITDEAELAGLPDHAIAAARQAAEKNNQTGCLFTLDAPSYLAIMENADSRALRQEMYDAYVTRASDQGPQAGKWDNTSIIDEILKRRLDIAKLLDFNNYAEESLATKMVKTPDEVMGFLNQLLESSLPRAREEVKELQQFAQQLDGIETLNPWDVAYYSEKLRQERYSISEEEVRPYFPEYRVLSGLFTIIEKLFNVKIVKQDSVDVWHPDVTCYAMYDQDDKPRAFFYLDLYARANKRGGAWMKDARMRRLLPDGSIQLPITYITCNFHSPIGNDPALFTHDEVVTLFHETGHGLQHMLTRINYVDVSGTNGIPWDAVEVASQFFENWAWEEESLGFISEHYQTKEPLPKNLLDGMLAAKNFHAAMQMLRQLEFALYDFRLHVEFDPQQDNQAQCILDQIRRNSNLIPIPSYNRFQNGFGHIFAGGYAAGYYSYKWAEVMAADAFSLFKEKGIFDKATSYQFLTTFLEQGGAAEPMDLFISFRGRKPRIEALLEQLGIINNHHV